MPYISLIYVPPLHGNGNQLTTPENSFKLYHKRKMQGLTPSFPLELIPKRMKGSANLEC